MIQPCLHWMGLTLPQHRERGEVVPSTTGKGDPIQRCPLFPYFSRSLSTPPSPSPWLHSKSLPGRGQPAAGPVGQTVAIITTKNHRALARKPNSVILNVHIKKASPGPAGPRSDHGWTCRNLDLVTPTAARWLLLLSHGVSPSPGQPEGCAGA